MLFGESAGAVNTCSLLASPLAAGLFQRALMQSGACTAATLEERFEEGAEFARSIGCDTLECLRAVPIEKIVSAMQSSAVNPDGTASRFVGAAIDGWVLPAAPIEVIRRRQHNAVPFVIGSNADETAGFGVPPMTEAAYRATILRIFGPLIGAEVLREYPARQFDSPREALVAVTTDAQFTCTARTVARAVTDAQTPPVYRYFFTYPAVPALGATHGIELRYVFQAADDALARTFLAYWTSFAADGVPAGPDQPLWTRYQSAADPYMELNNPARMERGVRTEKCDFWDRLAARAR
jgi:para-nitrobenzyl esterase